ncbi:hypothetical protein GCM10020220_007680 [Nonomuraea rubra]
MVFPEAAGILFTADPVSGNRTVVSIGAGFGLGEAFVSGLVNAGNYRVRAGRIIGRQIATQTKELRASPSGGTEEQPIEPARQHTQTLTDSQILRLELHDKLGRTAGVVAGNRFSKDVCAELTSAWARPATLKSLDQVDVLMAGALRTVLKRRDFVASLARGRTSMLDFGEGGPLPIVRQYLKLSREDDPGVVPGLIAYTEQRVEAEAAGLAGRGFIKEPEDVYFLSIEEFRHAVNTGELDYSTVTQRREAHETYRKLVPPRVITSEAPWWPASTAFPPSSAWRVPPSASRTAGASG